MTTYVKHPELGNKHVEDHLVPELVKQGWVKWPRTDEEKALGDGSDAAYWRKKYERDMAAALKGQFEPEALTTGDSEFFEIPESEPKPRNKPGPKPKG